MANVLSESKTKSPLHAVFVGVKPIMEKGFYGNKTISCEHKSLNILDALLINQ